MKASFSMAQLIQALLAWAFFTWTSSAKAESENEQFSVFGWGAYNADVFEVDGRISAMGSDTLTNVMAIWSYQFSQLHPEASVQVEGRGSSTAPPALIEGTADIGVMSRRMSVPELQQFSSRYGKRPLAIPVALDAVVVYVNAKNPISGLSLAQLDSIFSADRLMGEARVRFWGDLGVGGAWSKRPITVYGRNSASGTYSFFKARVMAAGNFKRTVQEIPGSSALVQAVGTDRFGVGYSGIGYKAGNVRVLPLSEKGGEPFEPSFENCLNGRYPLARPIYLYVTDSRESGLSPRLQAFMRYVLSEQAQAVLVEEGFFPIPRNYATELAKTYL